MIKPANLPLTANRWTPFVQDLPIPGVDLTGATFQMQVRKTFGDTDDPFIDLATAAAGSQGLSVSVDSSGTVPVSTIRIQISVGTISAIGEPDELGQGERGDDLSLAWDIIVTPTSGDPFVPFRGAFIIKAGVAR